MTLLDSLRVAARALTANKLRTSLTVLGIVIGVGAVVAMMSIGTGAQVQIEESIRDIGSNLLFIAPAPPDEKTALLKDRSAANPSLTLGDAKAIEAGQIPGVQLVSPTLNTGATFIAGANAARSTLVGVTLAYTQLGAYAPAEGELFTQRNIDARSRVIVLGHRLALDLFPDGSAVGARIRVDNNPFQVIAVMEEIGQADFQNRDNSALVPLTTLQRRFGTPRTARGEFVVGTISVSLVDERDETIALAVDRIGDILRTRHRVDQDDFTINSQKQVLKAIGQVTGIFTVVLGAIAGISLLVGGIGIMNIMLVSVTERTREIGIRKALGARRRDVLVQFLVEAVAVSAFGGAVGILLGAAIAWGVGLIQIDGSALRTFITPQSVALAVGVSVGIGLFFGIFPANRAARLNPIEALRYE